MAVKFYQIYDFAEHGTEPQPLNTPRTIDIEGKRICLVRLPQGYFAVDDKCPHAGARLGTGKCDAEGYLLCPVHRYRYDPKTGKGAPGQGDYVETYPVETRKDGVYVGLNVKWWQKFI